MMISASIRPQPHPRNKYPSATATPATPATAVSHTMLPTPNILPQNTPWQSFLHSCKQCLCRAQVKAQQMLFASQILAEQSHFQTQLANICNILIIRLQQHFSTIPILTQTNHLNARRLLSNTHPATYFPPITKLAFHDHASTDNYLLQPDKDKDTKTRPTTHQHHLCEMIMSPPQQHCETAHYLVPPLCAPQHVMRKERWNRLYHPLCQQHHEQSCE